MKPVLYLILAFTLISCDKGYRVRFANYHTETIDTVKVGSKIEWVKIAPQQVTDFQRITKGNHSVLIVTESGKRLNAGIWISSKGTGDRTIQIDGIEQVQVLEQ